jgi:hypothetical protein
LVIYIYQYETSMSYKNKSLFYARLFGRQPEFAEC